MINAFLSAALKFVVIIAVVIIMIVATMLIVYIARYFDMKADSIGKGTPNDQTVNAVAVLVMIDKIIESELINKHDFQIALDKQFDILHIDTDASDLSRKVRASINPDIFRDKSKLIITPEYIDNYIVNSCTTKMIEVYKSTNLEIAQHKSMQ